MGREERDGEREPGAAPVRAEQAPRCLCFIRSFGAHAAAPQSAQTIAPRFGAGSLSVLQSSRRRESAQTSRQHRPLAAPQLSAPVSTPGLQSAPEDRRKVCAGKERASSRGEPVGSAPPSVRLSVRPPGLSPRPRRGRALALALSGGLTLLSSFLSRETGVLEAFR